MSKEKTGPGTTIKITFGDIKNRDTFAKLGLQIDHMHFPVEKTKQKVVPPQCHSCFRFGHVAKYCKQSHLICSHCTGPNRYDVSTDRYSYSSVNTQYFVPVPKVHDLTEYPTLSSSSSSINPQTINNIIEACIAATPAAIERISEQLVAMFTKKLEEVTHQILSKPQLPVDLTIDSLSRDFNSDLDKKEGKKDNDCSLKISSNPGQLSIIDDGETAAAESKHTSDTHQALRPTISNTNGMKRSSNIESSTSHQPIRTNNSKQRKVTKTTKLTNSIPVI
ncbi:unnamed protein product [Rotaria sp. Silwood1]|nr:unnamed protein product [Rotaria sp. Silwood1]CAF1588987.1 unnamed protein product [Rotaria sp. Silwood1]CAF3685483.1 unnamed protein product [Rotaria sp. Silwood1]